MHRIKITAEAQYDANKAYAWMAETISPGFAEKWYQDEWGLSQKGLSTGLSGGQFASGRVQSWVEDLDRP